MMGIAVVATLHANTNFRIDLEAAKTEIKRKYKQLIKET
jgi:hypothetical protein